MIYQCKYLTPILKQTLQHLETKLTSVPRSKWGHKCDETFKKIYVKFCTLI